MEKELSEQDKIELENMVSHFRKHDETEELITKCPNCNGTDLWERGEYEFHDHSPFDGMCVDSIWECGDCGEYLLVIWKISKVIALKRASENVY